MQALPPPPRPPSPVRRALLMATGGILLSACGFGGKRTTAKPARPLSAEEAALKQKFRGLQGGQLRVDSLFYVQGLNIFDEDGHLFFAHSGLNPPNGRITSSYGADFGVPKFLRVEWRDKIEKEPDGALKRGLPGRAGTRGGQHSARTGQRAGQIARLPPEKPYGANADRQKDEQRGEA